MNMKKVNSKVITKQKGRRRKTGWNSTDPTDNVVHFCRRDKDGNIIAEGTEQDKAWKHPVYSRKQRIAGARA